MVTIKISGERGEGKTTLAIAIARMLNQENQIVIYQQSRSGTANEQAVRDFINNSGLPLDLSEEREFLILDESEDD